MFAAASCSPQASAQRFRSLLFFGQQLEKPLTFSLVGDSLKQVLVMLNVLASDKSLHDRSPAARGRQSNESQVSDIGKNNALRLLTCRRSRDYDDTGG
jgi:hypothetical protein